MKETIIPPRPLEPMHLAVRRDWTRKGFGWAIVSNEPVAFLTGWMRGYGESHEGFYVYRFVRWASAVKWARWIQDQRQGL